MALFDEDDLFASEPEYYAFGEFGWFDAGNPNYVYLQNNQIDVSPTAPMTVLKRLERINNQKRLSSQKKFEDANALVLDNLAELKKEWKVHVMPKVDEDNLEDLFAFFKTLLLGDETTKHVYQAKILTNFALAKRGSADEIAIGESNLPIFVFYIYGDEGACKEVLRGMQQTSPQPAASGVKPRFSSSFEGSKLFYFTQGSGDLKIEYAKLMKNASANQTQSLFLKDWTRFKINLGMVCASCSSSRVRYACERCPSQLYCNSTCQKRDWPQHAPFCLS